MRKIFVTGILIFSVMNAIGQSKKYVTFEANIAERNGDVIKIINDGKIVKTIKVNEKGVFKDTLIVEGGRSRMSDGVETTELFLKKGYDLKLTMNAKQFDETIVYTGKGSLENNVLAKRILEDEKYYESGIMVLNDADFAKAMQEKKILDLARLNNKKLDPDFVKIESENANASVEEITYYRDESKKLTSLNNAVSPDFEYENHKGGKTKLSDLRGKYVYIDIWATWCAPCRGEIPYLQKMEEQYKGKNIEFVSISIDVQKDHNKWIKLISDKQLGGIQLFADNEWKSDFITRYGVSSIPRFILIDPAGKIVDANATRPSSPELQTQLNALLN